MQRLKRQKVIGIVILILFAFLLMMRLGLFKKEEKGRLDLTSISQLPSDRETWMNIFQKDQKIGYAHRQISKIADGYRIMESVLIRINAFGMVQDLRFRTIGDLNHHLTLSTFDFELQSSLFRFKARGGVEGEKLVIFSGPTGSEQRLEVSLEKEVYLPIGLMEWIEKEGMKEGDSRTFKVFDPMSMAQRPVKITVVGEEMIFVMNERERAKKISVDFMGAPQFAWVGKNGTVLKEEGSLGLRLERTTREEAIKKGSFSESSDLAEATSIEVSKPITGPDQLKELKMKVEGIDPKRLFLDGDRQTFREGILTIRKETVLNHSIQGEEQSRVKMMALLTHPPFIQSDHPEIVAKAKEIVSAKDSDAVKAKKLIQWVHQNIQKRPVLSVPNALETLRNRVGDCNEHAVLLAALARASGIPAEVEAGLVYQNGRFYYHAWNVFHLGRWVTADATLDQFPADVTHLRFVRGMEQQIDLMGVIGRIKLEILSETR